MEPFLLKPEKEKNFLAILSKKRADQEEVSLAWPQKGSSGLGQEGNAQNEWGTWAPAL